MAYTLAKIEIREIKKSVVVGVSTYDLIAGMIPISIDGLSKIADSTEPAANEFSYFPTEKQFKVNWTSTSAKYVNYSFLISNKNSAFYALDPTDGGAAKYNWPPLLKKAPLVTEEAKNILAGLISYNSLSIEIASTDDIESRQFFGSNFSVMNKNFKLWRIEENTLTAIYTGVGSGVSFNSNSVKYSCRPFIKKLDEPATFGLDPFSDLDKTPIHICSAVPSEFYVESNYTAQGVDWHSVLAFNPNIGLVPCEATKQSGNIILNTGYTRGNYNNADYRAGLGPYIPGAPQYQQFIRKDQIADRDTGGNASDIKFTYNTSLDQVAELGMGDSPFLLTQPSYTFEGPVVWDLNLDGADAFYSPWEFYAEDEPTGGAWNISYWGICNRNFSVTPTVNWNSTTVENKFFVLCIIPKGSDAGVANRFDQFTLTVLPNYYTVSNVSGEPGTGFNSLKVTIPESAFEGKYTYAKNVTPQFFIAYEKNTSTNPNLSMKDFLSDTLKAAGFTPDLSAVDFDDVMQFYQIGIGRYRDVLEKILSSYGLFLRYNNDNETIDIVKIDDASSPIKTIYEKDFSNLKIKNNSEDTYKKIIFKNNTLDIGDRTENALTDFNPYVEVVNNEILNETDKVKEIEMVTVENPRTAEVSTLHFDNKYIYNFELFANAENLSLKLGDWITIESNMIPEPSKQAKVLITKKTIGETSIKFEGIKFASIN